MPRHYQDNDRPLPNDNTTWEYICLGSVPIHNNPLVSAAFINMESNMSRYRATSSKACIIGNTLTSSQDQSTIAKAVMQNRKQSSTTIVSHKLQRIIQGHIIWYWD